MRSIIRFVVTFVVVTGLVFTYLLITIIDSVGRAERAREYQRDRVTQCVTVNCE